MNSEKFMVWAIQKIKCLEERLKICEQENLEKVLDSVVTTSATATTSSNAENFSFSSVNTTFNWRSGLSPTSANKMLNWSPVTAVNGKLCFPENLKNVQHQQQPGTSGVVPSPGGSANSGVIVETFTVKPPPGSSTFNDRGCSATQHSSSAFEQKLTSTVAGSTQGPSIISHGPCEQHIPAAVNSGFGFGTGFTGVQRQESTLPGAVVAQGPSFVNVQHLPSDVNTTCACGTGSTGAQRLETTPTGLVDIQGPCVKYIPAAFNVAASTAYTGDQGQKAIPPAFVTIVQREPCINIPCGTNVSTTPLEPSTSGAISTYPKSIVTCVDAAEAGSKSVQGQDSVHGNTTATAYTSAQGQQTVHPATVVDHKPSVTTAHHITAAINVPGGIQAPTTHSQSATEVSTTIQPAVSVASGVQRQSPPTIISVQTIPAAVDQYGATDTVTVGTEGPKITIPVADNIPTTSSQPPAVQMIPASVVKNRNSQPPVPSTSKGQKRPATSNKSTGKQVPSTSRASQPSQSTSTPSTSRGSNRDQEKPTREPFQINGSPLRNLVKNALLLMREKYDAHLDYYHSLTWKEKKFLSQKRKEYRLRYCLSQIERNPNFQFKDWNDLTKKEKDKLLDKKDEILHRENKKYGATKRQRVY